MAGSAAEDVCVMGVARTPIGDFLGSDTRGRGLLWQCLNRQSRSSTGKTSCTWCRDFLFHDLHYCQQTVMLAAQSIQLGLNDVVASCSNFT
ncbi:unnamed protein product [Arabis nemorensis]|uniref:Uncharacterized protein n=1 Tax=Arabis nemorensis TaxID=586526 RepID=A0A565C739_9BRAS|nr:unnamed protein product [Arabis nemorensis]